MAHLIRWILQSPHRDEDGRPLYLVNGTKTRDRDGNFLLVSDPLLAFPWPSKESAETAASRFRKDGELLMVPVMSKVREEHLREAAPF